MNQIPGRYLPVVNEVVWARFDVLRPYRRAVVTGFNERPGNRTAVDFVWLEDDLDHERKVEAGAYGRIRVPTHDLGDPFPDLLQPWVQGEAPLIRLEKDWREDIPSLPADGTLLTARQSAKRLKIVYNTFASLCVPQNAYYDDFPLPWYDFMHKKMWRATDLDEWRAQHPTPSADPAAWGVNWKARDRRAALAKKRGGPGYSSSE